MTALTCPGMKGAENNAFIRAFEAAVNILPIHRVAMALGKQLPEAHSKNELPGRELIL